jgi:hypothetical protein
MSNEADFFDFGTDAEVLEPAPEEGIVQWYSSRDCETSDGEESTTAGWHIQVGKYAYLDKACEKAAFRKIILEQENGKNMYWQIGDKGAAHFFILAKGCHSKDEMNDKSKRAGFAFGWHKDESSGTVRNIKILKFRAYVSELFPFFDEENTAKPVIVVVKKEFVNDVLPILGREGHHRVLKANDQGFLEKNGKPTRTPYAGLSVLLAPGKKIKRMNGKGTLGSPVSPIVSDIPAIITADYIAAHRADEEYWRIIWEETKASNYSIEWSLQVSADIYGGNGSDEDAEPSQPSGNFEESYDHPFDDGGGIDPDEEHRQWRMEQEAGSKPAAKPQPSNSLKPMSDAQLKAIPGTAVMEQRRALQKLGKLGIAQLSGLTREKAGQEIKSAQPSKH